jgi:hypothetical protein
VTFTIDKNRNDILISDEAEMTRPTPVLDGNAASIMSATQGTQRHQAGSQAQSRFRCTVERHGAELQKASALRKFSLVAPMES